MAKRTKTIHDLMDAQYELAQAYAQDGAFHSAARVLESLAANVKLHAEWCDRQLEEMILAKKEA